MSRVAAILLAAGESRRMGGANKLELDIHGVPLLRRAAQTLLASRLQHVIAVLGHAADRIRPLLEDLPLEVVVNEAYREGQMTSVYKGLESLSGPCDGIMICLSDQPLLEPADIDRLIDSFAGRRRGCVLVPTYRGRRGNPIVLAYRHREKILNGNRNLGCKRFLQENPDLVTTVAMDTDHVVVDLDTRQDYLAFREMQGKGNERAMRKT